MLDGEQQRLQVAVGRSMPAMQPRGPAAVCIVEGMGGAAYSKDYSGSSRAVPSHAVDQRKVGVNVIRHPDPSGEYEGVLLLG